MTKDKSKDIRIEYNHFGFVDKIIELSTNNLKIQYFYNERAQKIKNTTNAIKKILRVHI